MNRFICGIAVLLLSISGLRAQTTATGTSSEKPLAAQKAPETKADAANVPKTNAAKEADIRRLLDLVGTKALVTQSMADMAKSIKPALTSSLPPGDYREKLVDLFFAKFSAKANPEHLLDLIIPSYDRNFSHQEILGLIEFYQTPLGKKSVSVLPKLVAESQEEGRKWGEDLGRKSMLEVLAEHPEFAKAIEEAQKNPAATDK
jgi:hypothetical protein